MLPDVSEVSTKIAGGNTLGVGNTFLEEIPPKLSLDVPTFAGISTEQPLIYGIDLNDVIVGVNDNLYSAHVSHVEELILLIDTCRSEGLSSREEALLIQQLYDRQGPRRDFVAAAGGTAKIPTSLPPEQIYATRPDKTENAAEFFERVWGARVRSGEIFLEDIRDSGDSKIIQAVRTYCYFHPPLKASDILPPARKVRRTLSSMSPEERREALRAGARQRMAKSRAKESKQP